MDERPSMPVVDGNKSVGGRAAGGATRRLPMLLTDEGQGVRQLDPQATARIRELLGDEAGGLTDEDLEKIQAHADALAHLLIEAFLSAVP